jgi:hypothetical protein
VASKQEKQAPSYERYAADLFYGAGPVAPRRRPADAFSATYSNGQVRPITSILPSNRPAARALPVTGTNTSGKVAHDSVRQDRFVLSREARDTRNGNSHWTPVPSIRAAGEGPLCQNRDGEASGPTYPIELLRSLNAVLYGPSR